MDRPRRKVNRDDLLRVRLLLEAYDCKAHGEPERALGDLLRGVWEHRSYTPPHGEDPLDDRLAAREMQHAHLVVEALLLHDGELPDLPGDREPMKTVCATPGCPELVYVELCLGCELRAG